MHNCDIHPTLEEIAPMIVEQSVLIEECIKHSRKLGYRLFHPTNLVDPAKRTMCPIGAVLLADNQELLHKPFAIGVMDGFDKRSPQTQKFKKRFELLMYTSGYATGKTYRRKPN